MPEITFFFLWWADECVDVESKQNHAEMMARNQVRNSMFFFTDMIKIHGGWCYEAFRRHHNHALIAFQASAFSSIELDYLCADLLQSSSTTWGLHINPSVLMAREKEPRLGAPLLQMCAGKNMLKMLIVSLKKIHARPENTTIISPSQSSFIFIRVVIFFAVFISNPSALMWRSRMNQETCLQIVRKCFWASIKAFQHLLTFQFNDQSLDIMQTFLTPN